jgi:hypothetical protein
VKETILSESVVGSDDGDGLGESTVGDQEPVGTNQLNQEKPFRQYLVRMTSKVLASQWYGSPLIPAPVAREPRKFKDRPGSNQYCVFPHTPPKPAHSHAPRTPSVSRPDNHVSSSLVPGSHPRFSCAKGGTRPPLLPTHFWVWVVLWRM